MSRNKRINSAQLKRIYWPAWRAADRALQAAGCAKEDAEEIRKEIHVTVTGYACSSKDLNNRQLDGCLSKFAAIATPNDGGRQAELADGPCKRLRFAIRESQQRLQMPDSAIETMAQSIAKRPLLQCDELQLQDIIKALHIHEKRHTA